MNLKRKINIKVYLKNHLWVVQTENNPIKVNQPIFFIRTFFFIYTPYIYITLSYIYSYSIFFFSSNFSFHFSYYDYITYIQWKMDDEENLFLVQ